MPNDWIEFRTFSYNGSRSLEIRSRWCVYYDAVFWPRSLGIPGYVWFAGVIWEARESFYILQLYYKEVFLCLNMSTSEYDILKSPPKGLTFDVFGTVVDWRKTVTATLIQSAAVKTSSSSRSANLSPEVRAQLARLTDTDWARFAQEWRNSYKKFTSEFVPGETEWRDVDTHHRLSLIDLLQKWNLEGLYSEDEVEELSKIWHFLEPWSDSSKGLHLLNKKFVTSTLSNGNRSLVKDLNEHGKLGFKKLLTSTDWETYKPNPKVYKGAAEALGFELGEVAMVAAHLNDLKAAKGCGFKTIYVERKQEEDWSPDSEEYKDAKTWVNLWVAEDDDGFKEIARRFGIK